jgi:type I restriction enzyme S subunit
LAKSAKFRFSPAHILYGKLRPYLGKVVRPDISGICSTDILPILPGDRLDRGFLFHFLRTSEFTTWATQAAVGANLPRLSPSLLSTFDIPLPPLPLQRRIAAVLDKAEALRAKRRAALAQLDSLTQSFFLDLFGDPSANPKVWPMVSLESVLAIPLRNGLSPSKSGKVNANVLTLSAITGSRFDATAWKTSTFISCPPANQSVSELDFLICRGNGNVHMVGKGHFPTETMPEFTFPDTMIAARIAPERIEREFLEHVWNSSAVRKQIESVARTTNGTFKVNQPSLEGIKFISPPLDLQREFARRVAAVEKLKTAQRAALAELDALFASLQHRAFRGEF